MPLQPLVMWEKPKALGSALTPFAHAIDVEVVDAEGARPGERAKGLLDRRVELMRESACLSEVTGIKPLRVPLFAVTNPLGRVFPPSSITVALEKLGATKYRTLTYKGDRGVALQHLGPLIGPSAHRDLWPKILDWVSDRERP
jgi:hypothetical protein